MSGWTKSDVFAPVSKELAQIAGTAAGAAGATAGVLGAAAGLLQVAAAFITGTSDPFKAAYASVIDELEDLLNDLFGAGVFSLTINQFDVPGRRPKDDFGIPLLLPREALQLAIASFDDLADENRPQFSDSAEVAAFGFLANAPSVEGLLDLIKALVAVFSIPDFNLLQRRLQDAIEPPVTPSRYPDWQSLKLNSIDQIRETQEAANKMLENLRGNLTTADDNLVDLINVLTKKVKQAEKIIKDLEDVLDNLSNATAASGLFTLNIPPGVGGNKRLKEEIFDCDLTLINGGYTVVGIFVGGGPTLVPIDNIRKIIF